MEKEYDSQTGNIGKGGIKMERESYSSGEVAKKLGIPRRTITDQAAKGRIPQIPHMVHRRYPRKVIDEMAEGHWPPVKASVKDGVLEIELRGLASEPFRIDPCPGEFPEIKAPELHLPGGPTLPSWHFPRFPNPFEVVQRLQQHLWG